MRFRKRLSLNEKFLPIESGFIISSCDKIHYESYGKGIPLIMLHGNGQDSSYFLKQLEFFKDYFNVILVDSRGHGNSDFGRKRISLNILTEDIQNLMSELKISKAFILGFSDGGNIAIKLAESIPNKILALITISPNLNPNGLKPWFRALIQLAYHLSRKLSKFKWFSENAQLLSLMIHDATTTKAKLKEIQIPVLIFAGQYDIIHDKHIHMIGNLIPKAKRRIIPCSGHNLLRTHSAKVNQEIYDFLRQFIDIKGEPYENQSINNIKS